MRIFSMPSDESALYESVIAVRENEVNSRKLNPAINSPVSAVKPTALSSNLRLIVHRFSIDPLKNGVVPCKKYRPDAENLFERRGAEHGVSRRILRLCGQFICARRFSCFSA